MPVVSAFLMPGNPLPFLRQDNPPWAPLATAAKAAGEALRASRPDVLLIYSTQWFAVLDELWQARPHSTGVHVDENWYDYGDLQMDLRADVSLAQACVAGANAAGHRSKAVDYEGFPIDSGTIVANAFLNPGGTIPTVVAANNLYHDFATTEALGRVAAEQADLQGKRAAVIAVGGLSAGYFDKDIDIAEDRIVDEQSDAANRALLAAMEQGGADRLRAGLDDFAAAAKTDMGMKHLAWLLGGVGEFKNAHVHGYGPTYGAGAAVVEFKLA
ncbi:tRNA U-34 5-methylaminomethyl-2-thiouridine biosynthesis protein [Sphingobium sp. 22B]|uniref:DODA-type extradiol aromatic ring-opening family dioxygenase n=1 Tax=unclassified Sphingobium TaxID=2611147 RepID=UPI000782B718|nr:MULTISPECIES: tRNA U-34 5-methylaminomethyl-2-thiouridine biosynthesis protein [unclassified Sphingobium]KXU31317.1 tRNA U-34 5-methylaminomethyl-2-thiouridine biosynthesis protein [Sphingobium sp. AM]KYC31364.1 tRNA U-34 5-methylaminomethyl-2-thiouridine biosynthesis protein [Sphingobium sp. 22B]OAP31246.1 tRNA U-34 5-methylaminomethyl-2-thiouridine biosynthesis protein [Sphingobium sp. 20006FA]